MWSCFIQDQVLYEDYQCKELFMFHQMKIQWGKVGGISLFISCYALAWGNESLSGRFYFFFGGSWIQVVKNIQCAYLGWLSHKTLSFTCLRRIKKNKSIYFSKENKTCSFVPLPGIRRLIYDGDRRIGAASYSRYRCTWFIFCDKKWQRFISPWFC